jgi:hypothetical protein
VSTTSTLHLPEPPCGSADADAAHTSATVANTAAGAILVFVIVTPSSKRAAV